jgi:hypothetical protein
MCQRHGVSVQFQLVSPHGASGSLCAATDPPPHTGVMHLAPSCPIVARPHLGILVAYFAYCTPVEDRHPAIAEDIPSCHWQHDGVISCVDGTAPQVQNGRSPRAGVSPVRHDPTTVVASSCRAVVVRLVMETRYRLAPHRAVMGQAGYPGARSWPIARDQTQRTCLQPPFPHHPGRVRTAQDLSDGYTS